MQPSEQATVRRATEVAIRLGILLILVIWCAQIVLPFVLPVMWAAIIAVAVHPLFRRLTAMIGGRRKLAAALFILVGLAFLIIPSVLLIGTIVEGTTALADDLSAGTLTVPPPPKNVGDWPVVGPRLDAVWSLASENLNGALEELGPQLRKLGEGVMSAAAGLGMGLVQFMIAVIIAGVFLAKAEASDKVVRAVGARLAGERGAEFADLAAATISSVAQGVLGIAVIQSFLAAIGLIAVGVPAAGAWALLVLIVAVIQLPPILVLGPIIFYVFGTTSTAGAVLFMIWSILVSISDMFLKPFLLGRGVDVPMLVILIGAIGGMLMSGILGLFVGAVVLSVGYKLFTEWLSNDGSPESAVPPSVVAEGSDS